MIYITDGDWNCDDNHGHDDSNLNDPIIKKLIEDYNIKIITLAFRLMGVFLGGEGG